jgi:hypothetical protein
MRPSDDVLEVMQDDAVNRYFVLEAQDQARSKMEAGQEITKRRQKRNIKRHWPPRKPLPRRSCGPTNPATGTGKLNCISMGCLF